MNKYIHWFSVDAIPIRVKKKVFKNVRTRVDGALQWYSYTGRLEIFSAAQSCFRNDVFYCSKQYRNNVATLCCAKSGRCESFRVISPLSNENKT